MRFDQKLLESAVDVRLDAVGAYLLAIVIAGVAFLLRIALDSSLGSAQFATYYPAVLITALLCGTGPALLVVVLSGLASWYLLMPPVASFSVQHPMQALALLLYFMFAPLAAVAVGNLRHAIARRRGAEARQRVLVHELEHRTRNLLGLVRAIANSTLRSSTSLDDFSERFSSRLAALGRVQGLSGRSGDSVGLRDLIAGELAAVGADGESGRVQLSGPEVELEAETSQAMALAVHELATNALKHGALSQQGCLSVSWQVHGPAARPRLGLDWQESGVAMPPEAARRSTGFGRTLIEKALPYDLGAKTQLDFTPTGVCCRIELPLGRAGESR